MPSTKLVAALFLAALATTARAAESESLSGGKSDPGASTPNSEIDGLVKERNQVQQVRKLRRIKAQKKDKKKNNKNNKNSNPRPPPPRPPPTPLPTQTPTVKPTRAADAETWPPTEATNEPTSFPTDEAEGIAEVQRSLQFYDNSVDEDAVYVYEGEVDETAPEIVGNVIVSNVASCPGVVDLCVQARNNVNSFIKFKQACLLLEAAGFLDYNTLDSTSEFTVFLPTNTAITRCFEEVYDYGPNARIPLPWIQSFLRQHIIKGKKLLGSEIYCHDRLPVTTVGSSKWPKVECKTTILNNHVPFVRGLANRGNEYLPKIRDPDDPIVLCKDNIYVMEDVILLRDP